MDKDKVDPRDLPKVFGHLKLELDPTLFLPHAVDLSMVPLDRIDFDRVKRSIDPSSVSFHRLEALRWQEYLARVSQRMLEGVDLNKLTKLVAGGNPNWVPPSWKEAFVNAGGDFSAWNQVLRDFIATLPDPADQPDESPEQVAERQIITLWNQRSIQELMTLVCMHPEERFNIDPRAWEEMVAAVLEKEGFKVTVTQKSRDGGKDIIAVQKGFAGETLLAVECKRYNKDKKVGSPIVQQLLGVVSHQYTAGLLVTTSSFTADAMKVAAPVTHRLTLRTGEEFIQSLRKLKDA